MNSTESYKRLPGSLSLYHSINQRKSPFLQRNLRQSLDVHESALNASTSHAPGDTASKLPETGMKTRNGRVWRLNTDLLEHVVRGHPPALKVVPKGFVKKGIRFVAKEEAPSNPSWLPSPGQFRLECNITCSIMESEQAGNETSPRTIFSETHQARLSSVRDEKDNYNFLIDMDRPFLIDVNQMLVTQMTGQPANGSKKWRKSASPKVVIRIGVSCSNSENAIQLLTRLDPDVDQNQELAPELTELRCQWKTLPECPKRPLQLRRYHDDPRRERRSSKKLDYDLDIQMAWSTSPHETHLEMYNRARDEAANMKLTLAERPRKDPKKYRIVYVHHGHGSDKRSVIRSDLRCMFCPQRLPHSTFDRLHFHYMTNHDHFDFRISNGSENGPSFVDKRIELDLADTKYTRASDHVPDEREFEWEVPAQPFDLKRYLRESGDARWSTDKQPPKKIVRPPVAMVSEVQAPSPVGDGIARPRSALNNAPASVPATVGSIKPPETVRDLPSKKRRRHLVPNIPGVTIYRTTSKRIVEPGEELSESDDDVEQSWLDTLHNTADFPQLTGHAREFAILYDEYLEEEQVPADRFLGDALVRFTRARSLHLAQPDMLHEFTKKLNQLRRTGLISGNYVTYCLDYLAERKPASSGERDQKDGERPGYVHPLTYLQDGDVDMIHPERIVDDSDAEAGAEVSPAVPSQRPRKRRKVNGDDSAMQDIQQVVLRNEVCVCGVPALGVRGVITCSNLQCPHADFHMNCMGLPRRVPGWRCPDCSAPPR